MKKKVEIILSRPIAACCSEDGIQIIGGKLMAEDAPSATVDPEEEKFISSCLREPIRMPETSDFLNRLYDSHGRRGRKPCYQSSLHAKLDMSEVYA